MQDCYAGDIGDYGKFALLRELQKQGLSIGVNWYKTATTISEKQDDGKYCIPDHLAVCDPELAFNLRRIFHSKGNTSRSIEALEKEDFIEGAVYFSEPVSMDYREEWHQRALREMSVVDLVFLDPDNGMIVPTAASSQKRKKFVLDTEVRDYLRRRQSVLVYQHRPRENEAVYIDRMMQRFMNLSPDVKRSDIQAITFPRYSVRDYFAISINEDHRLKINRAITNMVNGIWGSGKKPMCRLPVIIENKKTTLQRNSVLPNETRE